MSDDGRPAGGDGSLRRSAMRSSFWTLGSFGAAQVMRFGCNVLFSYVLYPEAFATMMVVNAIVQGLQMFSDIGLGPSIVQHRRGDEPRFLDTAFTMQVLRGALMAGLCLLAAGPVAEYFAQKDAAAWELQRLLPWTALSLFLGGLVSTRVYTASRHLALGRVTLLNFGSQVVGSAATVSYALVHRDVFAFVFGSVIGAAARSLGSYLLLPGHLNRFGWDRDAARSIWGFGGWIFVSTIAAFFSMQLDRLVFPRAFAWGDSGVYSLAAGLASMVPMVVGSLQIAVVFPVYSRLMGEGQAVGPALVRVKRAVFAVGGLGLACVMAGSDAFLRAVYDPKWYEAAWMMSLLAIGAWFQILEALYGALQLARGLARWVAFANAAKPIAFVTWFLLVDEVRIFDAVVAWVCADVVRGVLSMVGARLQGALTVGLDLRMTAYLLVVGGGLWAGAGWFREATGVGPWTELAAVGVAALLCYAPVLLPGVRTLRRGGGEGGDG